ncbi:MAG: M23 family metallopeptidase [Bacteroidales bacterium]
MRKLLFVIIAGLCCCTSHRPDRNTAEAFNHPEILPDTILEVLPQSDSIKKYSERMKRFYRFTQPAKITSEWFIPFDLPDRSDLKSIRVISGYGTYRSGFVKGHRHSGIDIVPAEYKDSIVVYPAGAGTICLIRPAAPNKTVIVKHRLNDSTVIYSSYIHLKDIYVKNGQEVNQNTQLGVLYSKAEAGEYNGDYDHLHFEIKKRIDDYCCASWLCMSPEELDEYFYNPSDFWESVLNQ